MVKLEIEQHPLGPLLPANVQLLMLESFLPQKKQWSMDSYYPNWNNNMWRITGFLFFSDRDRFVGKSLKVFCKEHIISSLNEKDIVLFDTVTSIRRLQDNASDRFLEVVQPTDIAALLWQLPLCKAIVATGRKTTDTLCALFSLKEPEMEDFTKFVFEDCLIRLYRMPSSSRAYPLALEKRTVAYRVMYQDLQVL